jgi:hypothetical protein
MAIQPVFSHRGPPLVAVAVLLAALFASAPATSVARAADEATQGLTVEPAGTAPAGPGTQLTAPTFTQPPAPTDEQRRSLLASEHGDGPAGAVAETAGNPPLGPSTTPPEPSAPSAAAEPSSAAPTDFVFYRNQRLPTGGERSAVNEPSTAQGGRNIFATGNWYAAYSHDTGSSWTYLNPFAIFGSGFCCDQLTTYSPSLDRYFWVVQYNDRLVIANSPGNNLTTWCYYNWTPGQFGLPAGASFDYNKLSLSNDFVYLGTNVYGANGGSLVARFPTQAMSTCAGFDYNYYYRTTEFAPSFIERATDAMYWGTNWTTNLTLGSTFRILRWADNATSATVYDRNITSYVFMSNGTGNCASADGVVLNWCNRTDSRTTGPGYLGRSGSGEAVLGWAFNARQDSGHPFPYIRRIYFRASDLAYLGASEFWGNWAAHLYPALAANQRGHVGMAYAWGGGTGTAHYYPGSGVMIDDDVTPLQPWTSSFYQPGAGNPCLNPPDGLRRWGDYLDVHPLYPGGNGWVASGFALTSDAGACNAAANVSVANVAFGRERDRP